MWNVETGHMMVAGHRGDRASEPENTVASYLAAIEAGVDMLEVDVHITRDRNLVMMHDPTVDRTTDGTGRVADLAYSELRKLNAGVRYGREAQVPSFEELMELMASYPSLLVNVELKDYPDQLGEEPARMAADLMLASIERWGVADRLVVNSFHGGLLEYVDEQYGHRYRLHGFYPFTTLRCTARDPMRYLYCACLWPAALGAGASVTDCPDAWYHTLTEGGVEPWLPASAKSHEALKAGLDRGAKLITSDEPREALRILRALGAHR